MIKIKRIYEPAARDDGTRVLVDRLWPRGLKKGEAQIDVWLKELAPSGSLRRWFKHDVQKWEIFKKRYFAELARRPAQEWQKIVEFAEAGPVTLLFASKEEHYNNAAALREFVEPRGLAKAGA